MKIKELFKLLFNPFIRIAGWQAFIAGIVIALIMGFVASRSGTIFDGVLDAHFAEPYSILVSYSMIVIDLSSLILVMWIAGLIFSKKFRFIDILGTMTLSKAPYLFIALFGFLAPDNKTAFLVENPTALVENPSLWLNFIPVLLFSLLIIPILVWSIALMYKALKISCVIKQNIIVVVFIFALIIAEIISKIAIAQLLS